MNPNQDWWNSGGGNAHDWWNNGGASGGSRTAPSGSVNGSSVPRNTFNAQNLPLGDSDLAADNYIGDQDVGEYFEKIWQNRTNKAGGSRQIFDKFTQWASPEKIRARGGDPNDLQWQLVQEAIRTGKVDPRLRRDTLRRGLGTGLQETARHQQHKPKNFFTSYLLDPLVMGGLGLIPGVGPALAVGYGGIKGGVEGGPLGALTGALGGYGAAGFSNWLKNGFTAGFGALNNVNAFMPADIAGRAGTSTLQGALPYAGAVNNVGKGAALAGALRGRNTPRPGPRQP